MTASPSKLPTVSPQPSAQNPVKSQRSPDISARVAGAPPSTTSESATATPVSATAAKSTVRISAAALAALQESRETPAQTAVEARHGDAVAKNIVARQQAHAAEFKTNSK